VNEKTILDFASALRETEDLVKENGLFFSDTDFNSLLDLLKSAKSYLEGKERLDVLRQGAHIDIDEIKKQIDINKKWLDAFKDFIQKVRSGFNKSLAA
jgi:hypothetical protein